LYFFVYFGRFMVKAFLVVALPLYAKGKAVLKFKASGLDELATVRVKVR
jgi:hypothetical protein